MNPSHGPQTEDRDPLSFALPRQIRASGSSSRAMPRILLLLARNREGRLEIPLGNWLRRPRQEVGFANTPMATARIGPLRVSLLSLRLFVPIWFYSIGSIAGLAS